MKIGFLGDSVTEGCFEIYYKNEIVDTVRDKINGYPYLLLNMLREKQPNTIFEIVNAGQSGDNSSGGLARVEKDIINQNVDIAIVCFGLNDVCGTPIETFKNNIGEIVSKLISNGIKTIFMTPNTMNFYVHKDTLFQALPTANLTALKQNDGTMDKLISAGILAARNAGAIICDCYLEWNQLVKKGQDTTLLLANLINHPTRKMHTLFAENLFNIIVNLI